MKTLIFAAFIIAIGMASCSVSQPGERDYYSPQRVYNTPYEYNPYYNPQVYNNGYRYDSRYNNGYNTTPVYVVPAYPNRNYRRYNNEQRREYNQQPDQNYEPKQAQPQGEKRLIDGTRISPDGTITRPNGQVKRK